jgi:biofilm PGA synthesis N-glycosyltransferase PgaC
MSLAIIREYLTILEQTWIYTVGIAFLGLYPILTSLVYIITAGIYYFRRAPKPVQELSDIEMPFVSVIIPAYCEESVIGQSIQGVLDLDYPLFELIVVNDGSTDRTADVVRTFLKDRRVRLLDKTVNEGKALALNDAILCARAELILIMDADAVPDRNLLRAMTPHFRWGRVGAVAGNPRVRNTENLLSRLQAIEFSSVIGLMRRAQRIWGRVMCVSGVVGMFRKSAITDAGLFTPGMATEDIDLTWRLQTKFYDIRYEPTALVWMIVPESISLWWKQRRRWALGLGQVLRRHSTVFMEWKWRRMHPLYIESALSYLWSLTFILVASLWTFSYMVGHPPRGGSPIPNFWGMLLYTACLIQLACGVWMDSKHDPEIVRHFPVSIIYPTFYWVLITLTSCVYTTLGLVKRIDLRAPMRWHIQHNYVEKH